MHVISSNRQIIFLNTFFLLWCSFLSFGSFSVLASDGSSAIALDQAGEKWSGAELSSADGDSVINLSVIPDIKDFTCATVNRIIRFTLPAGDSLGPIYSDSLIFLSFIDLPSGGISTNISKDSVSISPDGVSYYRALAIGQSKEYGKEDSICIAIPLIFNPRWGFSTMYVKINGFINPGIPGTYGVRISTEATPIPATKADGWSVVVGDQPPKLQIDKTSLSFSAPYGSNPAGQSFNISYCGGSPLNWSITADAGWLSFSQINGTGNETVIVNVNSSNLEPGSFKAIIIVNVTGAADSPDTIKVTLMVQGILPGNSLIRFLTNPDSLVPDTINSQSITADIIDQNLVKKVQLRAIGTLLNLGVDKKFSMAFTSDTAIVDSLFPTQPADSIRFQGKIPARKLATQVRYQLLATDYLNRITISETRKYIIAPRRGKKDLSTDPVNITDFVRTTWLILDAVNNPSVIDYLGLDTDQSGDFDTPDLVSVLNIMKQDPAPNWTYAQSGTNILYIGKAQATAGESDTVNVFITTDKPYSGADIILNFDPAKLKYVTTIVNSGAFFQGSGSWNVIHGNGSVRVACCSFNLSTIPLCDSVKFFSIVMNPAEGLPLGEVDTIHIRGILAETDNNYNVTGKSFTTYPGLFTIGPSLLECALSGDVTADSRVDIFDVLNIVRFALGQKTPTALEKACADMNSDGTIDIFDVLACVNKALGKSLFLAGVTATDISRINEKELKTNLLSLGADKALIEDIFRLLDQQKTSPSLPKAFSLGQNAPNPFNPSTTISYSVPEGQTVQATLKVYDLRGRLVRTLVDAECQPGNYSVFWDGRDEKGQQLSSGVYLYRMRAGDFTQTRKMVLLK